MLNRFRTPGFFLLLALLAHAPDTDAATLRVPEDYSRLVDAGFAAADGDTVLVSPGTYSVEDGHYLWTEVGLVVRSVAGSDETILEGGSWASGVFSFRGTTATSLLQGFTVRNYGDNSFSNGSALQCRSGRLTVRDCVFEDIFAPEAAAAKVSTYARVHFDRCRFERSRSSSDGGAVGIFGSDVSFLECTFESNVAVGEGGAITVGGGWAVPNSVLSLEKCFFLDNQAQVGGAIAFMHSDIETTSLVLRGCTLVQNRASQSGGALYIASGRFVAPAAVSASIFWGNTAEIGPAISGESEYPLDIECSSFRWEDVDLAAGGTGNFESDPQFCLVGDNPEDQFSLAESSPCLPSGNTCGVWIGAHGVGCAEPPLGACCFDEACTLIVEGDCAGSFFGSGSTCESLDCATGACCTHEGLCVVIASSACDGMFLGPDVTCDPLPCAPSACCFPNGVCSLVSTAQECESRGGCFRGGTCEPSPCIGSVWDVPADRATIQGAIDAACPGDTILVSSGTYQGEGNRNIDFGGKDLVLKSKQGAEATILDGGNTGRLFHFHSGESAASRVEGFTVRNGFGGENGGGGFLLERSSPTISGCRIIQNQGIEYGGGIAAYRSNSLIQDCVIAGNRALSKGWPTQYGGGVHASTSIMTFNDCVITGNTAAAGGGLSAYNGRLTMVRCTVASNRGIGRAGGLFMDETGFSVLSETIIWGNSALNFPEVAVSDPIAQLVLECCVIDPSRASEQIEFRDQIVLDDPLFCAPQSTDAAPTAAGDYRVAKNSPALDPSRDCPQIGALGVGCSEEETSPCCAPDGTCRLADPKTCIKLGYIPNLDQLECDPNPCEQPGACCFRDGRCDVRFEAECTGVGRFLGIGVSCDPSPCGQPGACCLDDYCDFLPKPDCDDLEGTFLGEGTRCFGSICEPNSETILLLHPDSDTEPEFDSCASVRDSVAAGEGTHKLWVIAAQPPGGNPRITELAFGLDYDPTRIEVVLHESNADSSVTTPDWPLPGSGIRLIWNKAETERFLVAGWLEIHVRGEAPALEVGSDDVFALAPHPDLGAIVDDDIRTFPEREIDCLGTVGIGVAGTSCCWDLAACCLALYPCYNTTRSICESEEKGGFWISSGVCGQVNCWPPVALAGVELSQDRDGVQVSWHAESDRAVAAFYVLRSNSMQGDPELLPGQPEIRSSRWYFRDHEPPAGTAHYWIEAIEDDGNHERFGPWSLEVVTPSGFFLDSPRPNPSAGSVSLELYSDTEEPVVVSVFDAGGRRVWEWQDPVSRSGWKSIEWDGRDESGEKVSSGVYFFRARSGSEIRTTRVSVIRRP